MRQVQQLVLGFCFAGMIGSTSAHAWSRQCAWSSSSGIRTIDTAVHCASFESLGYECDLVKHAILLAHRPWNEIGGVNVRLGPPLEVSSWSGPFAGVLYRMDEASSSPSTVAITTPVNCQAPIVTVFARTPLSFSRPTPTDNRDLIGVLTHETGHALGLNDADAAPGRCGGVPNTTTRAVMRSSATSRDLDARTLFRDDWNALRSGACAYAGATPTGVVQVRESTDRGASWALSSSWATGTNLTPDLVRLPQFPTGSLRIEAAVNTDNRVEIRRWNGGYISVATETARALAGPAVEWNQSSLVLVAYPSLEPGNEGVIRVLRSLNDGATWSAVNTTFRTNHRVGLAYHPGRYRFYMVFSEGPPNGIGGDCTTCGRLNVVSTVDGVTFSSPFVVDPFRVAQAGPGIGCEPAGKSKCWIVYPDAVVLPPALRSSVIDTDPSGTILGQTNQSPFPYWNGHHIVSRNDVDLAFEDLPDTRHFVITFRETNVAQSQMAVWLRAADFAPPAGFLSSATSPYDPGFPFGGEVVPGVLTGVGASQAWDHTGPIAVYTIAHK
jgi:hypothetical protein